MLFFPHQPDDCPFEKAQRGVPEKDQRPMIIRRITQVMGIFKTQCFPDMFDFGFEVAPYRIITILDGKFSQEGIRMTGSQVFKEQALLRNVMVNGKHCRKIDLIGEGG